jgi:Xaa-Pro aminopeptidase
MRRKASGIGSLTPPAQRTAMRFTPGGIRGSGHAPVLGFVIGLMVAGDSANAQPTASRATPPISNQEFAARRASLAGILPDGVILALGGREPREDYLSFFQIPNFLYLTGIREPEAALIGVKTGAAVAWTVFVAPKEPSREVWTGVRVGPEAAAERWGLPGRSNLALRAVLDSLLATATTLHVVADLGLPGRPSADDQLLEAITSARPNLAVRDASSTLRALRAHKSASEVVLIRRAAEITAQAHREAARTVRTLGYEYEVQAEVERVFRRHGAERPAFASIVGSGPNATTLHYNVNNRQMRSGDMVVVDVGASVEGYAADMTRTFPVNGVFSAPQRAIYQIVRDAQAAAERQARPGRRAQLMSDSATTTLAAGLARLGLIESPEATYDCSKDGAQTCRQVSLYYMHGLGHGIGLEVHDPDRYAYGSRLLEAGSIFTLEPGIYVREDVLATLPPTPRNTALAARLRDVVNRYLNIGVRIEDDYLVTRDGLEWLTKAPREIAEVEAAMRRPRRSPM